MSTFNRFIDRDGVVTFQLKIRTNYPDDVFMEFRFERMDMRMNAEHGIRVLFVRIEKHWFIKPLPLSQLVIHGEGLRPRDRLATKYISESELDSQWSRIEAWGIVWIAVLTSPNKSIRSWIASVSPRDEEFYRLAGQRNMIDADDDIKEEDRWRRGAPLTIAWEISAGCQTSELDATTIAKCDYGSPLFYQKCDEDKT